MLQNRIWTAACLQLREWPNDYFCQLCLRNLETTAHLFQDCTFTRRVWDSVGRWIATAAVRPENWDQIQDLSLWFVIISNSGRNDCKDGVRSLDHAHGLGNLEGEESQGFYQDLQNSGANLLGNTRGGESLDQCWKQRNRKGYIYDNHG
jgi:hypothetical protein